MNTLQTTMIELIKSTVTNEPAKVDPKKIDFDKLFEEADAQELVPLVYLAISKLPNKFLVDKATLDKWKKHTLFSNITQIKHQRQVERLLGIFYSNSIEVVLLKGLILRSLYPTPELRTMCDADLLVHEKDLHIIDQLLTNEGYTLVEKSPIHFAYDHPKHLSIEIHWTLKNELYFEVAPSLTKDLLEDSIPFTYGNQNTLMLNYNDFLFHLLLHKATHLSSSGFGLRQVIDFYLFANAYYHQINWELFITQANEWRLEKFAVTLLGICNDIFHFHLPRIITEKTEYNRTLGSLLIEDLFNNGVYGYKEHYITFGNQFANKLEYETTEMKHPLYGFIRLLFPHKTDLKAKYKYVELSTLLLPLAWTHHLIHGLLNKEYPLKDKIKISFLSVQSSKKRSKLLKLLEL